MTRTLTAGATSAACSRRANAWGSPSASPTKTENSQRDACSAARIARSSSCRSRGAEVTSGHSRHRCHRVGVRAGLQLVGAGARAAEPLVVGGRGARRDPLAPDHGREVDRQGDHDEEQQRDARRAPGGRASRTTGSGSLQPSGTSAPAGCGHQERGRDGERSGRRRGAASVWIVEVTAAGYRLARGSPRSAAGSTPSHPRVWVCQPPPRLCTYWATCLRWRPRPTPARTDEFFCQAALEWTDNEQLAEVADVLIGKPLKIIALLLLGTVRPVRAAPARRPAGAQGRGRCPPGPGEPDGHGPRRGRPRLRRAPPPPATRWSRPAACNAPRPWAACSRASSPASCSRSS